MRYFTWKLESVSNILWMIEDWILSTCIQFYLFAYKPVDHFPRKLYPRCLTMLGYPYKHNACIPRWNDVETLDLTSFQRGIHVVCLQGYYLNYHDISQVRELQFATVWSTYHIISRFYVKPTSLSLICKHL